MQPAAPRRITEFEGLRGLLSWWVVVGHALQECGCSPEWLGRGLRVLVHGEYPVEVFIILSGFVIAKLHHDAQESYGTFIARRFLRIWPAYMVCLLATLALRPGITAHAPMGDPAWAMRYAALRLQGLQSESEFFGFHMASHVAMLHGAVPDTLLPSSAFAFLGPAWSISLEWQFYLVAPPLLWILRRWGSPAWCAFGLLAGIGWALRFSPPWNAWFPMESFLWQKLLLFAVGIASHRIWSALHDRGPAVAPAFFAASVLVFFFTLSTALSLWIAVLAATFAAGGMTKRILNCSAIQFIGKVSYSTYLGHMMLILGVQRLWWVVNPNASAPQMLVVLLILGVPLILVLSALLYRWVESPAIAFGRRLNFR